MTPLISKTNILWVLKLYSLTLVIPVIISILNIAVGILGIKTKYGFLGTFKVAWVDYYITGKFCGIDAWRWHLLILLGCIVITTIAYFDNK
jgi:hypothetical protein